MAVSVDHFAHKILDARDRIQNARDPQSALDALEEFKALANDPDMLAILASAYLLTSSMAFEGLPD